MSIPGVASSKPKFSGRPAEDQYRRKEKGRAAGSPFFSKFPNPTLGVGAGRGAGHILGGERGRPTAILAGRETDA